MQDLVIELEQKREEYKQTIQAKRKKGIEKAEKELDYYKKRARAMAELNVLGYEFVDLETGELKKMKPLAITTCENFAKGIEPVATLKFERDVLEHEHDALNDEMFRILGEIQAIEKQIETERRGL